MDLSKNLKLIYETELLQFKSEVAILRVEHECCCKAIAKSKEMLEATQEPHCRDGLRKYILSLEAERAGYEFEFEKYKAQYFEMLRDVMGVIENTELKDLSK